MSDITINQFQDDRLQSVLQNMARVGVTHAAEGFGGALGEKVIASHSQTELVPLPAIPTLLGGAENDAVGIYLQMQGALPGQMMLVLPHLKAFELADLVLGVPVGTTQQLGSLERSALAEVGNMTGSFFLSAIASLTGLDTRPSPPAVVVDMVGAIIDIIVATSGGTSDQVLVIRSAFQCDGREVQADFWVIPDTVKTSEFLKNSESFPQVSHAA
ncbi:MAG: chemotaxis protein CheC [Chloroflexi bacterium]|nr:chemotaxis protein CheC [Chloroflexota bacterium]